MKRVSLFILVTVLTVSFAQAQTPLTYNGGVIEGRMLTHAQVKDVMSVNSEALRAYNSGKVFETAGLIFDVVGAGFLVWDLGKRIEGGKAKGNDTLLAIGFSAGAVGAILGLIGDAQLKKSVKLYNSKLGGNSLSYQIDFGLTQTGGVGFNMRF